MNAKLLLPWLCVAGLAAAAGILYASNRQKDSDIGRLRADSQRIEQLESELASATRGSAETQSQELMRLRKDNEDLLRLRNEVRQLRDEKQQLSKQTAQIAQATSASPSTYTQQQLQHLLLENQQLRLQIQALASNAPALGMTGATRARPRPEMTPEQAQVNACINNLRQIDAAKQMWAMENERRQGSVVNSPDIAMYFKDHQMPTCPGGGGYTLNTVGHPPLCNIAGHALPR
jgi:hypothetical protein